MDIKYDCKTCKHKDTYAECYPCRNCLNHNTQTRSNWEPEDVMIKCNSHRSKERLFDLIGEKLQGYYSLRIYSTGGFYKVPADKLEEVLKIKGITKASKKFNYNKCWS